MAVVTAIKVMVAELLQMYFKGTGVVLVVVQNAQQLWPKVMFGVTPSGPTQLERTPPVNSEGNLQADAVTAGTEPERAPETVHCLTLLVAV